VDVEARQQAPDQFMLQVGGFCHRSRRREGKCRRWNAARDVLVRETSTK
jgi:hypothetical protein